MALAAVWAKPAQATGTVAGPTFVQQVTAHGLGKATLTLTPSAAITAGNRLIVEVGIWASGHPTAKSVTDSAGNTWTELTHFTASDGTEQSIWTAPITAGGATKPTITITPTATADIGAAALEYAGLSTAASTAVLDVSKTATGTTTSTSTTVSSGATPATTGANELALGFYTDSGFSTTPTAATGWTRRAAITGASDMDLLTEDQSATTGATPNASATTTANTIWLMSTLVLKTG